MTSTHARAAAVPCPGPCEPGGLTVAAHVSATPVSPELAVLIHRLVPGEWVERARCGHRDPELFYPVGTAGPALRQVAEAKAVCARCPVVDDCLEWALDVGEGHGIWGGTTPEERRFLRRDRGGAAAVLPVVG